MYLGAAIKLAIPFAILDRQVMQKAYGGLGAQAQEAQQAYLAGFGPLLTQTIFARCTHYGTTDSPSHL